MALDAANWMDPACGPFAGGKPDAGHKNFLENIRFARSLALAASLIPYANEDRANIANDCFVGYGRIQFANRRQCNEEVHGVFAAALAWHLSADPGGRTGFGASGRIQMGGRSELP